MAYTFHLSFSDEDKELADLHKRAIAEGKANGKPGLTSQIYGKGLREYYGVTRMGYDEVVEKLRRMQQEDEERETIRKIYLQQKEEFEKINKEREKREEEAREFQRVAEARRKEIEQQLAEKRALERQQEEQAKHEAEEKFNNVLKIIKQTTEFPDRFAKRVAKKYIEQIGNIPLKKLILIAAQQNSYVFDMAKFEQLEQEMVQEQAA